MTSKRLQALVMATAVVAGYAGAAAFSAWGLPAVPIATDFGPDDGLTRYVLTATSGAASDDLLAELERTDGVVNAQRLSDGRAFVATKGLAPQHLEALPGIADAEFSTTVPVFGTVTDPYFPGYATTWTTPAATPTASTPSPTPTSTPPRAGTAARARARSSPSSTPATTPTTPSSRARCGPTHSSPAARWTSTATARPATATAGTS
jgi:hypothetical protein